ncbi:MAG: hydrogenase maturation protease [Acidimicrobiales bacterium]
MSSGVLVAGIGNVFQSDDAFGVEVANRLSERVLPSGVRVEDFGIRGVHLAYELLGGYDGLVIIDALPMGEPPGTLAIMVPELDDATTNGDDVLEVVDAHTMNPDVVLGTLRHLGGSLEKIFIIGCQPANLQDGMGLSPSVAAAVDDAAQMCCQLVSELLAPTEKGVHP